MRRSRPVRNLTALLALLALLVAGSIGACTDDPADPSTADVLAELEGRSLTPAEVAEREQVAALLCRLDEAVLREVWDQLNRSQLEFQDFVFSRQCPERNALYAAATGRFTVGG